MNPKSFTVNICCFIAVHSDKMTKKKPKFWRITSSEHANQKL